MAENSVEKQSGLTKKEARRIRMQTMSKLSSAQRGG